MGTEENKAVVRRFWNEFIIGGDLEVGDELLAPNYVNLIREGVRDGDPDPAPEYPDTGGDDRASLKAAVTSYLASIKQLQFEEVTMVAEGDAVFARMNTIVTLLDGGTRTSRGLAYYRVVDGKIVMNDLLSVPT